MKTKLEKLKTYIIIWPLIFLLISIFALSACNPGSKISARESVTYSTGNTSVTIEREATAVSYDKSSDPPKVELPPSTYQPTIIGEKVTEIQYDNNLDGHGRLEVITEPVVVPVVRSGGAASTGASSSLAEMAQGLMETPIWIGAIAILIGIVIFFTVPPFIPRAKQAGIGMAIAGAILIGISYTIAAYSWLIAMIGAVIIIGFAFFILLYYLRRESKAVEEVIDTVEGLKGAGVDEKIKQEGANKQSDNTRQLVRDIRIKKGYKT